MSSEREGSLAVELLGPAGAGKTTLLGALRERDPRIVAGVRVPAIAYVRPLLRDVAPLALPYLGRHRGERWLSRLEMRSMIYLAAWGAASARRGSERSGARVTLFDHGPVFRLAMLREFGPPLVREPAFERWWERSLDEWAGRLDLLVWLDAPDDVLRQRIDARPRGHAVKGRPADEAQGFLDRYRRAFELVVERMSRSRGPVTLRFDAQRESAQRIADSVLAALDAKLEPGLRS